MMTCQIATLFILVTATKMPVNYGGLPTPGFLRDLWAVYWHVYSYKNHKSSQTLIDTLLVLPYCCGTTTNKLKIFLLFSNAAFTSLCLATANPIIIVFLSRCHCSLSPSHLPPPASLFSPPPLPIPPSSPPTRDFSVINKRFQFDSFNNLWIIYSAGGLLSGPVCLTPPGFRALPSSN